jgi:tetratricopeptide (TPR) repeat protein
VLSCLRLMRLKRSCVIGIGLFYALAACKSTEPAKSDKQAESEDSEDRDVTPASKPAAEDAAPTKSPVKKVITSISNQPSFQGSIPSQVLTDTIVAMEDLVQKNPRDVSILVTYLGLLRLHGQGGQIYDSVVQRAGSLGAGSPWFLLETGYGALVRKDYAQAEFLFNKAEKAAKGDGNAKAAVRHASGVSNLMQGRIQQAVFEMKQAASGEEPHLPALLTLGYLGLRYGDYQGAERSFRSAMTMDSKNVNARMGLAIALRVKGNPQEALGIMQSLYESDKNDRRVAWNYALVLADYPGKEKEAIALLEKYFQLPGTLPEVDAKATQLLNSLQAKAQPKAKT